MGGCCIIPIVFAGLTNGMLYLVQRYTRQNTYSGIVRKMFGRGMEVFVDIVQVGNRPIGEV